MLKGIQAHKPFLVLILLVFGLGNTFAQTPVVVIPLWGGDDLTFPGDGNPDTDSFGTPGHGPALSYTDNGDGTFTDNNTGLMWEIKDDAGGIHDKDRFFTWTTVDGSVTDPDGTLFTIFLDKMNNKCDGDETTICTTDADCAVIGNGLCGHAGYTDWCIPNARAAESLIDYSKNSGPTISDDVPGLTPSEPLWSSTSYALSSGSAHIANFDGNAMGVGGRMGILTKTSATGNGRAVRSCSN